MEFSGVPADPARDAEAGDLSVWLRQWREGDLAARDRIAAMLLPELRILAERGLRRLDRTVSLHPGDLVQESLIELLRRGAGSEDAAHLRALAAGIVRTTLVDYLRVRNAQKRGGGCEADVSVGVLANMGANSPTQLDLLAVHQAMILLERNSPRAARVVEMRVFGGMSELEITVVLGVSRPTVSRDWATAKLWLARELASGA